VKILRRRASRRLSLSNPDRLAFVWLYRLCPSAVDAVAIIRDRDSLASTGVQGLLAMAVPVERRPSDDLHYVGKPARKLSLSLNSLNSCVSSLRLTTTRWSTLTPWSPACVTILFESSLGIPANILADAGNNHTDASIATPARVRQSLALLELPLHRTHRVE